jgi:hypothetical protein
MDPAVDFLVRLRDQSLKEDRPGFLLLHSLQNWNSNDGLWYGLDHLLMLMLNMGLGLGFKGLQREYGLRGLVMTVEWGLKV